MKRLLICLIALLLICPAALALEGTKWIDIAPGAILTDAENADGLYALTLTKGAPSYDGEALVLRVLGEGYETKARTEWSNADEYWKNAKGREPWLCPTVTVYDERGNFDYCDPWVGGERGGEYQPPRMNMTYAESTLLAREYMKPLLGEAFAAHPNTWRVLCERWSYAGRWMTESEFLSQLKNSTSHTITFEHLTAEGLPILDEGLTVTVGVNGLSGFSLNWHEFAEGAEKGRVMPLEEALQMANSTRLARTTLLYAGIAYSNRVTMEMGRPDEYHLGWVLVTSMGNYFVDAVQNAHVCDMYEY